MGLGASVGGKQAKEGQRSKGAGSVSGKVGSSRTESQLSKSSRMMIRKEAFIAKYWAVHMKDTLRLSTELKQLLKNPNALRTKADFETFFDRFGTHYPLATLMGGWAGRRSIPRQQWKSSTS